MARKSFPAHESIWWHSRVRWDGDVLVPIEPYEPYNPFAFYYPPEKLTREEKSLYYEFLSVDASNKNKIAEFCERFGVLGPRERQGEEFDSTFGDSIHHLTSTDELRRGTVEADFRERFGERFGRVPPYSPDGFGSMHIEDFRRAQALLHKTISWAQQAKEDRISEAGRQAGEQFQIRLNVHLRMVRPRLYWQNQKGTWVTGWDTGSLEAVMYLMLMLDIVGPGLMRTCLHCGTLFLGTRSWTKFCSFKCQSAYKQKVYREKKAKKSGQKISRGIKATTSGHSKRGIK